MTFSDMRNIYDTEEYEILKTYKNGKFNPPLKTADIIPGVKPVDQSIFLGDQPDGIELYKDGRKVKKKQEKVC